MRDEVLSRSNDLSDAYTTDDIEYIWKDKKPIQLKDGLKDSLPSFTLSHIKTGSCTSKTNTGALIGEISARGLFGRIALFYSILVRFLCGICSWTFMPFKMRLNAKFVAFN